MESSGEVEAREQGELLQPHGARAPRLRLAHGQPAVVEGDDGLDRRPPGRQVRAREEPALVRREAVDLLGDEPLVVRTARLLDLVLARATAALVDDAAIRRRERGVPEELSGRRRREVEVARSGPALEQARVREDRRSDPLVQRVPLLRVPDRELEHVAEAPGAELAQEQEPAAEGAGYARGEDARAWNELVAELVEALDRRRGGRDALPAERERLLPSGRPEHRGHLAARPVQMGLDDLEDEPGRGRGVERVAASLEHRHPGLGSEPVRRRNHPERAAKLRTRRERHDPKGDAGTSDASVVGESIRSAPRSTR